MNSLDWTKDLFAAIDAMDGEKFASYLTEDAKFTFGSMPPAEGIAAIGEQVGGFLGTLKGISHSIDDAWQLTEDEVMVRGDVTYTRQDESQVTLPFADYFGMSGDKVKDYQVYIDIAPLFNPE